MQRQPLQDKELRAWLSCPYYEDGSCVRRILEFVEPKIVSVDPEIMGGASVFEGTRVPVQTLLDYLEGGDSIDDFLADFPTVSRELVVRFLEEAFKKAS